VLGGRAWLNAVRDNPDVLGYLLPGFAALAVLAASGVGALLVASAGSARPRLLAAVGVVVALATGALQLTREAPEGSLARFSATAPFDDARLTSLPPRSVVVLSTPEAVFRHWEAEAVSALRADVTLVPLPFLGYGGVAAVLAARTPEVEPLLAEGARDGMPSAASLARLAAARPVYVEPDPRSLGALAPWLVPEGVLYRVQPQPTPLSRDAGERQHEALTALTARLDDPRGGERETRRQLLWVEYVAALYWTARGERATALAMAERALTLAPEARELVRLRAALRTSAPRTLDAFLPHGADPP